MRYRPASSPENQQLAEKIAGLLLERHFPETLHADILQAGCRPPARPDLPQASVDGLRVGLSVARWRRRDSIPDSGSVPPPAWPGVVLDVVAALAAQTTRAGPIVRLPADDHGFVHRVLMPVAAATPARTRRPACPGRPPAAPGRRPGRGGGTGPSVGPSGAQRRGCGRSQAGRLRRRRHGRSAR